MKVAGKKIPAKRFVAAMLAVIMAISLIPISAFVSASEEEGGTIVRFKLDSLNKAVEYGTRLEELDLRDSLAAEVYTEAEVEIVEEVEVEVEPATEAIFDEDGELLEEAKPAITETQAVSRTEVQKEYRPAEVPVEWLDVDGYDGQVPGSYVFKAVVADEIYVLPSDVSVPTLIVTVKEEVKEDANAPQDPLGVAPGGAGVQGVQPSNGSIASGGAGFQGIQPNNGLIAPSNAGLDPSEPEMFTVTFRIDGEIDDGLTQIIPADGKVARPEDPVKEGYTFVDWRCNERGIFNFDEEVTSDIELRAWFTQDEVPDTRYDGYWKAGSGNMSIRNFRCPVETCNGTTYSSFEFLYTPKPASSKDSNLALIVVTCRCGVISEWQPHSNGGARLDSDGGAAQASNQIGLGVGEALLKGVYFNVIFQTNPEQGELSYNGSRLVERGSDWDQSWEPEVFANRGWTFWRWVDQDGHTYPRNNPGFPATITQNYTFTAQYTDKIPLSVTYDPNGGAGAPIDNDPYFEGEAVTVKGGVPTKAGYTFEGWLYDNHIYWAGDDTIIMPASDITFLAQWSPRTDLPYVVNYYVDSIAGANLVGSVPGTGILEAEISADLALFAPAGYVTPGTRSGATAITAVEADNVVNVVYDRKADLPYVVNYYVDSVAEANLVGSEPGTGILGAEISADLTLFAPAGYAIPGTRSGATTIAAVEADNVVNVVYDRKTDIPYVINYYTDGIEEASLVGSVIGTGTLGAEISADLTLFAPAGYVTPGTRSGATTIAAVEADNVVNVVYERRADLPYVINYYADGVSEVNYLDSVSGTGTLGAEILADLTLFAPAGYVTPGHRSGVLTITAVGSNNVVNVVYERRADLPYVINYYVDSIEEDNLVGSVSGTGTLGTMISADQTQFAPAGYVTPGHRSGANVITAVEENNVVNVLYERRADLPYVINYYTDSIEESNLVGSEPGTGTLGAEILADLALFAPAGYVTPGHRSGVLTITAVEANNVVNVVYERRADLPYVINYYVDGIAEANLVGSEPGTGTLGATITADLTQFAPAGYSTPGTRSGATTITAVEEDNVVNVVYERRTDLPYVVNYYLDSMEEANLVGSEPGTGTLGAAIEASLVLHAPAGYVTPGTRSGATTITAVEADNVVNVVYSKRTDLPYVINYYADSIEEANLVGSEPGTGTLGEAITVDLAQFAPAGYVTPGTRSGASIITAVEANNVVNVVYDRRTDLPYVINYYADSIDEANLVGSEPGTGTLGAAITADLAQFAPAGYVTPGTRSGASIITAVEANNVVNVVYDKRTDIPYVVNYYADGISEVNFLGSEPGTGTLGADILANLTLFAPAGYVTPGLRSGVLTITAIEADNVVNVVYERRADLPYVINYYTDSIEESNLVGSIARTGTLGAVITADQTQFAPAGYVTPGLRTGASIITAVEANNVVNVVYERRTDLPYVVNYYVDSMEEANLVGSEPGTGTLGATITADLIQFAPAGYVTPGLRSGVLTITAVEADNVVNVLYERRTDLPYVVNYYADSIEEANLVGSVGGTGTLGAAITADLTQFAPAGYVTPGTRSGATTITAVGADNVVNVVYDRRTDLPYVINYYTDSIEEDNLVGSEPGTGTLGAAITADLTQFAPAGYVTPGTRSGATTITAVETANLVNVVYDRRTDLPYVVNYYVDSIEEANLVGSEPGTGTLGAAITADLTQFAPAGYVTPGTRSGASIITAVEANNVVNVVYGRRADLPYVINYYMDGVSEVNFLDRVSGTGILGAAITADLTRFAPAGYVTPGLRSGVPAITAVEADNVVNVVYERRADIPYVINYYADSIEASNLVGSVSGTGILGAMISADQTQFAPAGYVTPGLRTGATIITPVEAANVVNVVYDRRTDLPYVINYYTDSIEEANLVGSELGTGALGAAIEADLTQFAPAGYETPGTRSGVTTISAVEADNVVNVVYTAIVLAPVLPPEPPAPEPTPPVTPVPTPVFPAPAAAPPTIVPAGFIPPVPAAVVAPAVPAAAPIAPAVAPATPAAPAAPAETPAEPELPTDLIPIPEDTTPLIPIGEIDEDETPFASFDAYWALVNLVCTIITAILAIVLIAGYFIGRKRREDDDEYDENMEEEEYEETRKRKGLMRLSSLIPAVVAIVAFILTEDMSLPMQMVDRWTILMVFILLVQLIVVLLSKKKWESDEDEDYEAEGA